MPAPLPDGPILFFDGVCGLCNRAVDFALARGADPALRFAPLQGTTAASVLPESDRRELNTLVLLEEGRLHRRSAAVVRLLRHLRAPWPTIGALLWVIPAPLRDLGYRLVARMRYRLFGQRDACRMPTPADLGRLLD